MHEILDYALHYACAMAALRLGMAMLGLRAGHNWIMPGLCLSMCGLSVDYAWIVQGLCVEYAWIRREVYVD